MQYSSCNLVTKSVLIAFTFLIAATLLIENAVCQNDGELKYLEVKVVDTEGKPMADVEVEVKIDGLDFPLPTDEEGIVPLNVPDGGARVSVSIKHEGYLSQGIRWEKGEKIPDEFTIPMKKGTTIGGIVQDQQGNPIEGAIVEGHIFSGNNQPGKLRPMVSGELATTDAEGRWKYSSAPEESAQIQLRINHDDFIKENVYGRQRATRDQLATLEHVFILEKGIKIAGKITDPDGNPVSDAKVAMGSDRFGSGHDPVETDAEGIYSLQQAKSGSVVITVFSPNWAPDIRTVSVQQDMDPVNFQLEKGHHIRIRVTDAAGEPIESVWIAPDTWRGHRSLTGLNERYLTDENGVWESNSAPHDVIDYDILKKEYMSVRNQKLVAQDEEHLIVMPNPLEVEGKVVDALTGLPIQEFSVVQGSRYDETREQIYWERWSIKTHYNGEYDTEFDEQRYGNFIRIEAEGYRPAISRLIKSDEGKVTIDFEMNIGNGPTGIVKTSDGKPAKGAVVGMATTNQTLQIRNGQLQSQRDNPTVTADAEGKFTLPFPESDYLIVVLHDSGWKQISGSLNDAESSEPLDITLEAWGKLSGKLLKVKEPMAGEVVQIYYNEPHQRNQPRTYWSYETNTDNDGAFHFDRLKAGFANAGRQIYFGDIRTGHTMSTSTHNEQVEIKPGESTTVQIGGTGRIIKGQFVVPDNYQGDLGWNLSTVRLHQVKSQTPANPLQAVGKAIAQLGQKTVEPAKPRHQRNYTATINPEGTFEFHDIPAGNYQLNTNIQAPVQRRDFRWQSLGSYHQKLAVEEGDQPMDLGKLTLKMADPKTQ